MRTLPIVIALAVLSCKADGRLSQEGAEGGPQGAPAAKTDAPRPHPAAKPVDLMPRAGLEGFTRVPLDPLADKPVWNADAAGTLLTIDGVGAREMLLYDTAFGDGVLTVEWRFVEASGDDPVYNGGVYVRTSADGKSWVQLQVAYADEPPVVGDLIAQVPGQSERIDVFQEADSPAKPVGQWNTYEVRLRGSEIALSVNGQKTISWDNCPMLSGRVGLQAEGAVVEVRRFSFQPL